MKIFDTRIEMIHELIPKNGVYAEIGVFKGEFSKELLTLHPKKLVLFDLFEGSCGSGDVDGNNFTYANMDQAFHEIKNWNEECILLCKGDSSEQLSTFEDNSFDMIYIDGDHSYNGCKKDLDVSFKKIKKNGGFIMGHDYEMNPVKARTMYEFGVKQAVDEFCATHNLEVVAKGVDGCVSYAIKV